MKPEIPEYVLKALEQYGLSQFMKGYEAGRKETSTPDKEVHSVQDAVQHVQ